MKLFEYQEIARSYAGTDDWVEQIAYAVCHVYKFTHDEVDNMDRGEFLQYSRSMEKVMRKIVIRPWYFKIILITEASKITLGQFIEIQHWVKDGEIDSLPLVAASILKKRGDHKTDTERMRKMNVRRILSDVRQFMESFNDLMLSYSGLFEKEEMRGDETEEEIELINKEKDLEIHPFIERYGWIFSAKKVAEFEGISLEQAYGLPVIQAFNDLAYLKSEQNYQKQLNK